MSDGRAVEHPLEKYSCLECGAVGTLNMPTTEAMETLFSNHYSLYAHSPGHTFENVRQRLYAEWISRILADVVPQTIAEIGCGNGSLLHEIVKLFPDASVRGLEPNTEAARFGQMSGIDIRQGLLSHEIAHDFRADVLLSVNVLEHVPLPLEFLGAIKVGLGLRGIGLLICPDGERTSSELLIYDHFYSYTRTGLWHLLARVGLKALSFFEAPAALGEFMAVLFTVDGTENHTKRPACDCPQLHRDRAAYMASWQKLENSLTERLSNVDRIGCFGIGEAANLIATYAPGVWQKITVCTADEVWKDTFRSKPVVPYSELNSTGVRAVLLGVRPASQPPIADRLEKSGYIVIRWDDLIVTKAGHAI